MIKILQQLGLSEKEAKVYLAALDLGSSTVQEIARKAGINRATTYFQIESLMKMGLMSSVIRGKKKYFSSESPNKLLKLLEVQGEQIKEKENDFKKIFPELQGLFTAAEEKPKVRFYEGKEGIKSIQDDILRNKFKSLEVFIPLDDSYRFFPPRLRDHRWRMAKKLKKIPTRVIYTSQKGTILPKKEKLTERRFISFEKFPFHTEINIYGNKIALASHQRKIIGVIIESKDIAESLKSLFNLAWETAEKYQK